MKETLIHLQKELNIKGEIIDATEKEKKCIKEASNQYTRYRCGLARMPLLRV